MVNEALQILVVDDDEVDRGVVLRALRQGPGALHVTAVATLQKAREALERAAYHCAILDHNLPDGDGLGLIRELSDERDMAVLMLTGHGGDELGLQAVALGAQEFIQKDSLSDGISLARMVRFAVARKRAGGAASPLPPASRPGAQLGSYVLEEELGSGGMATVYKARHTALGRHFALKLMQLNTPILRQRLRVEGQVQSALRHPNLVPVVDAFEDGGAVALVMELIDGPSLDTWLERTQPSEGDSLAVFLQLLDGVSYIHEQGFIHRDLKPANILLQLSGDRWRPRITDFGLAKSLIGGGGAPGITRSNVAMGTPAYMAPEQIQSAKDADQRSDIYALGCILYEMICRRPAYRDARALDMMNAVTVGAHPSASTLVPELAPHIAAAIARAMSVHPEERFTDCAAFREALTSDRPLAPRPPRRLDAAIRLEDRYVPTEPISVRPSAAQPTRGGATLAMLGAMLAFAGVLIAWAYW